MSNQSREDKFAEVLDKIYKDSNSRMATRLANEGLISGDYEAALIKLSQTARATWPARIARIALREAQGVWDESGKD